MRPPFKVELWKPVDDTPHLLAVTESFEAAEKAYQEAVANLRVGEVVRVRDALGTLCFLQMRMTSLWIKDRRGQRDTIIEGDERGIDLTVEME